MRSSVNINNHSQQTPATGSNVQKTMRVYNNSSELGSMRKKQSKNFGLDVIQGAV